MGSYEAFIVYSTYIVNKEDKTANIHLFGRLKDNRSFEAVFAVKPYFFIKKEDKEKAEEILNTLDLDFSFEDVNLTNLTDEPVIKIITNIPKDIPLIRRSLEKQNIPCYEADIRFVQRFLMDNNIKTSCKISGTEKKSDFVDVLFEVPKIKSSEYTPKNLRVLSIDIETSRDAKVLYSISLYSEKISTVLINSSTKNLKNAESFSSEKALLKRFLELVKQEDPDIITGWNVVDFDFAVLRNHFKKNKVPFTFGRMKQDCSLRIEESFMRTSSSDFKGRLLLDSLDLTKISFIKLDDYKLNTAAKTILNQEKLITSEDRGNEIDDLFLNNQQKLVDYNLKDSKLVYDILNESKILSLSIQRSKLTGMMLDKIQASIASFDSLYLPLLREKKKVAFSLISNPNRSQIRGGFVLPSKPGIYDWVIVCDFKSLYPSLMRSFNIDPYSYFYDKTELPKNLDKEKFIQAPNSAVFKNQKGILPEILEHLFKERQSARDEGNELARYAIKILMNSFFGALASHNCRFSTHELGDSITSFAQSTIKQTMKLISDKGYDVIYGDTDSIFIDLNVKNYDEAVKIGNEISKYITDFFEKWIPENYARESFLDLEFEKTYSRFLIPYTRGSKEGAKKRYAGLMIKQGKEDGIDFTGLEFVRRDWTEVSKVFQLTILNKIFHKEEIAEFVKEFISDLKKGKYDDKLIYKKALRKNLDEYTKTTPPHVKAARKLSELKSNIVEYIMTVDGPEPIQEINHSIDYDHYIDKQIKPIADSVLVFFDQKFDDIILGTTQKSLFGF